LSLEGAGGHSIQNLLPSRPGNHGPLLHRPGGGAALLSVHDRHSSSKPRTLTTSDPPGPLSNPRPKNHALYPVRWPRSRTSHRMLLVRFQGARSLPLRPRPRTTKIVGIGHGSLQEGDEADTRPSSSARQRTPSGNRPSP